MIINSDCKEQGYLPMYIRVKYFSVPVNGQEETFAFLHIVLLENISHDYSLFGKSLL